MVILRFGFPDGSDPFDSIPCNICMWKVITEELWCKQSLTGSDSKESACEAGDLGWTLAQEDSLE